MSALPVSAASQGLIGCEACRLLVRPAHGDELGHCPRCGAELQFRRAGAVQKTWALVIAAAICYIPANLLPVMVSNTFAGSEDDTIISGVIYLYSSGSWPLALIVLIASVMVPIGKLVALAYVLVAIQRGVPDGQYERMRLFRIVHIIGKWSMLDIFVVTFTVALVQLPPLMAVVPGEGVLFFAAVVVLTMIAAETLDPRLIWDGKSENTDG